MKTNELIALLASDPLPSRPPAWHLPLAATVALGLSLAMVVGGWGLHADLRGLVASASYQLKTVWLLGLALSSGTLVWRLARPAERDGYGMHGIGVFLLIMACTGAYNLWQAEPANRLALLMGQSWWSCPLSIALIALPWLAVWLLYLRHMAPTRLAWSGVFVGRLGHRFVQLALRRNLLRVFQRVVRGGHGPEHRHGCVLGAALFEVVRPAPRTAAFSVFTNWAPANAASLCRPRLDASPNLAPDRRQCGPH